MRPSLPDQDQNFWQMTCIWGSAYGILGTIMGGQLAQTYGTEAALSSICIGNFILWMIGLAILSMTEGKNNAIENIKEYLGKGAGVVAALIWIVAFLIWYALQIKITASAFIPFFPLLPTWQIGAILGIFTAFLCLGGIRLIKNICTIGLPILLTFAVYTITMDKQWAPLAGSWKISLFGIFTVILGWLPGAVNLPTFFRHARSKEDAILALSLTMFCHIFFQYFSIRLSITHPNELYTQINTNIIITSVFILTSFVCSNLINIYFGSVAWETLISRYQSAKKYLAIGLLGTFIFIGAQITNYYFNINKIEKYLSSYIAILGFVLLIDSLIKIIVRHRPRPLEKLWSNLSWMVGCAITIWKTDSTSASDSPLIAGVIASALLFLCIIFIEETMWAIKTRIIKPKKH